MTDIDQEALLKFLGLDLEAFKAIIDNIKEVETDEKFFQGLAAVALAKGIIKDALEVVEAYEAQAKGLINTKAKVLYGPDWQVIKGERFKISRSYSGAIYEVDEDTVESEMVKVKITPNAKAIETFREAHDNKLPQGVSLNEHRSEAIRITVK